MRGFDFGLEEADGGHHAREGVGEVADFIVGKALHGNLEVAHADVFGDGSQVLHGNQDGSGEGEADDQGNEERDEGDSDDEWDGLLADAFDVMLGSLAGVASGEFAIFSALAEVQGGGFVGD